MTCVLHTPSQGRREVPAEELGWALDQPVFLPLEARDWCVAVGPEHQDFLQAMITQDVGALTQGMVPMAACKQNGRMLASGRMWGREQEIWLGLDAGSGKAFVGHMERFRLRRKAWIVERQDLAAWHLGGPGAGELLQSLELPRTRGLEEVKLGPCSPLLLWDPLWDQGWTLLGEQAESERIGAQLREAGARPISSITADAARVRAGVSRFADEGVGRLPLEAGHRATISFDKGCYLGQELVCRVDSQGEAPTQLWLLEGQGPAPLPGSKLKEGGQVASSLQTPDATWLLAHLRKGLPSTVHDEEQSPWQPARPCGLLPPSVGLQES